MGTAVGILLLCVLELEICLGGQITPHLPAKVAKKSSPGQGLMIESGIRCRLSYVAQRYARAILPDIPDYHLDLPPHISIMPPLLSARHLGV